MNEADFVRFGLSREASADEIVVATMEMMTDVLRARSPVYM